MDILPCAILPRQARESHITALHFIFSPTTYLSGFTGPRNFSPHVLFCQGYSRPRPRPKIALSRQACCCRCRVTHVETKFAGLRFRYLWPRLRGHWRSSRPLAAGAGFTQPANFSLKRALKSRRDFPPLPCSISMARDSLFPGRAGRLTALRVSYPRRLCGLGGPLGVFETAPGGFFFLCIYEN